jgi:hypothetical protein
MNPDSEKQWWSGAELAKMMDTNVFAEGPTWAAQTYKLYGDDGERVWDKEYKCEFLDPLPVPLKKPEPVFRRGWKSIAR